MPAWTPDAIIVTSIACPQLSLLMHTAASGASAVAAKVNLFAERSEQGQPRTLSPRRAWKGVRACRDTEASDERLEFNATTPERRLRRFLHLSSLNQSGGSLAHNEQSRACNPLACAQHFLRALLLCRSS